MYAAASCVRERTYTLLHGGMRAVLASMWSSKTVFSFCKVRLCGLAVSHAAACTCVSAGLIGQGELRCAGGNCAAARYQLQNKRVTLPGIWLAAFNVGFLGHTLSGSPMPNLCSTAASYGQNDAERSNARQIRPCIGRTDVWRAPKKINKQ